MSTLFTICTNLLLLQCIIKLCVLQVCLAADSQEQFQSAKIKKIDINDMRSWGYDELSLCTIFASTPQNTLNVEQLKSTCTQKLIANNIELYPLHKPGLKPLQSGGMSKPLDVCNEEVPLSERGFDEVIEGFENGAENKHLLTLFLELSVRNVSVVLIGDSINNQVSRVIRTRMYGLVIDTYVYACLMLNG